MDSMTEEPRRYRRRASLPHDLLTAVGRTLYGEQWQRQMARELDVSPRNVQRWANEHYEQECPIDLAPRIIELLERQGRELKDHKRAIIQAVEAEQDRVGVTMSATFQASTVYGDWRGTAMADDDGHRAIRNVLREQGKLGENDFVVGVELDVGENHSGKVTFVQVYGLAIEAGDYEEAKAALSDKQHLGYVKRISAGEMTVEEFFGLFKRFSVVMSWQDFNLTGREYAPLDVD